MTEIEKQRALDEFYGLYPRYSGLLDEWEFSDDFRFYDAEEERYITENQLRALSERYIKSRVGVVDQLIGLLMAGMFLPRWVGEMRKEIRSSYYVMYLLGRGGQSSLGTLDGSILNDQLRNQYIYLNNFANAMAEGGLSEAQIAARAGLYFQSSRQMFERGRAGARGLILPAYPGESSECGVNCRCKWRIINFEDKWSCYWVRSAKESCATCLSRSAEWSPYVVYK